MSRTYIDLVPLTTETCCRCGIPFAATAGFFKARLADGKRFYCPNGHDQHYTTSAADKVRTEMEAELERERQRTRWAEERANDERDRAQGLKRDRAALRGQITKIKKRIGRGVCPCCNRHFTDLEAHMHTQHPEFKEGKTSA